MLKSLADRLAEAFAEWLHRKVRRELWGYAPDEALDGTALIREEYRGIRPAPGYPACPDHAVKATLFAALEARRRRHVNVTENYAMLAGGVGRRASISRIPPRGTSPSARSAKTSSPTSPRARV